MKKVPYKGSWIVLVPIAAAGFSLNLKQLANICSLSNLMTYAFIDIAVVILRLKGAGERGQSLRHGYNQDSFYGNVSQ